MAARALGYFVLAAAGMLVLWCWQLPMQKGFLPGPQALPASRGRRAVCRRAAQDDWRDFRARLVQQELEGSETRKEGWAYQTDLLEQGSLILSVPGDYWALRRQYFCKAVMLVISHDERGSCAVVLNRPTAFTTADFDLSESDLPTDQLLRAVGLSKGSEEWKVWFGGDCEGIENPERIPKHFCLHTLEKFADKSRCVIKGIFVMSLVQARFLVALGQARREDFMVLVGYTGWAPGQLQDELDRGGAWVLGAADRGLLLGLEGQDDALSLTERLEAACSRSTEASRADQTVGDGIYHWQQLFSALQPEAAKNLDSEDEVHNDEMIRLWIDAYLRKPESAAASQARPGLATGETIAAGTILRGSASQWLLGRPAGNWPSRGRPDPWRVPGQYLHKAVLMVVETAEADRPTSLVLLNGPQIAETTDSKRAPVLFGGPSSSARDAGLMLPLPGGGGIVGTFTLPAGTLQELLGLGALEIVETVSRQEIFATEVSQRWAAAGGKLGSLRELAVSVQGDQQLRKWYRSNLGIMNAAE
eukprot:TRINITY_DN94968_c0_g1_i1.p1 TRINITY_DN94968_c0_g1~~TRINITY_DN94968_c0_g1_i1.p1  ORF type:complete len:552 (-),score=126.03 TRINITY_DN94968_c0_g1_i1:34-1629(-)